MWTWILNPKNTLTVILVAAALAFAGAFYWYRGSYESATEKVKQQESMIAGQAGQIKEYKKNIELAKEHQERVEGIERQGATIRETIREIKVTRGLTDEEINIAADITNRINGVRHKDVSGTEAGGKVLPGSGKSADAGAENNT